MVGINDSVSIVAKDLSKPRMANDERDVQQIKNCIEESGNPFDAGESIYSLRSGITADVNVQQDLLQAKDKGTDALKKFIDQRLCSNDNDFFAPLPKQNLRTFGPKKCRVKAGSKEVILKADRNLFTRLLVIGQTRKMDMKEIMQFELGPLPWSIAAADGTLNKTTKSVLPALIEQGVPPLTERPEVSVCLIDLMCFIHAITRPPETFSDLADMILTRVMEYTGTVQRVDIIGDQYPKDSIKGNEHKRRRNEGTLLVNIRSGNMHCPKQWTKYLSDGRNKTSLQIFLQKEWTLPKYAAIIGNKSVFVTSGPVCVHISVVNNVVQCDDVPQLHTTQEEAETRLFLHVKHASDDGHTEILIRSSDTDVEVLACYFQSQILARMYIHAGTHSHPRYICIPDIVNHLGEDICEGLPGLHAITGCDTVSAFSGRGKKKGLQLMKENRHLLNIMQSLGRSVPPQTELFAKVEEFTCSLYGIPNESINSVRHTMFCKAKHLQSHHIPPTQDALKLHTLRANYQVAIWIRATLPNPPLPHPEGNGWVRKDDVLEVDWMKNQAAPEALLSLIACGCKSGCQTQRCTCLANHMKCTDACHCSDQCQNTTVSDDSDDEDDDEENERVQ